MIDIVKQKFIKAGFHYVTAKPEQFHAFYKVQEKVIEVLFVIDYEKGFSLTKEQYIKGKKALWNVFLEQNSRLPGLEHPPYGLEMLTVVLVKEERVEEVKAFTKGDTGYWIINRDMHEIMIFEDQPEDFADAKAIFNSAFSTAAALVNGIKQPVNKMLSKAEATKNAVRSAEKKIAEKNAQRNVKKSENSNAKAEDTSQRQEQNGEYRPQNKEYNSQNAQKELYNSQNGEKDTQNVNYASHYEAPDRGTFTKENPQSLYTESRKRMSDVPEDTVVSKEKAQKFPNKTKKQKNTSGGIYGRKLPVITTLFVLANVAVFFFMDYKGIAGNGEAMLKYGAMYEPNIRYDHEFYRLVTSMFLHFNLEHLIGNMIMLFFLGEYVENSINRFWYLLLFMGSGIAGNILSFLYNWEKGIYAVSAGASGAVFGLMGAFVILAIYAKLISRTGKKRRNMLLNKTQKTIGDISMIRILLMAGLSIYFGFIEEGVDVMAHIGGFVSGAIFTAIVVFFQAMYRRAHFRAD